MKSFKNSLLAGLLLIGAPVYAGAPDWLSAEEPHLVQATPVVAQQTADEQDIPLEQRAQDAEKLFFAACQQDMSAFSTWQYLPTNYLKKSPKVLGAFVGLKNALKLVGGSWAILRTPTDVFYDAYTRCNRRQRICDTYTILHALRETQNPKDVVRLFWCNSLLGFFAIQSAMSSLDSLKTLQQRLIVCADFIRTAQEVAEKTNSTIVQDLRNHEDAEIRQLMELLARNTFTKKAAVCSNWGAILAAHYLFEKHKDVFKPLTEMVNNFVIQKRK